MRIVSGGQTGVDRAALDAALAAGISCEGWCPKGRKAEDGRIDDKYPLKETPSEEYDERTAWNVRDSDATLILCWGEAAHGTKSTLSFVKKDGKPCWIVDMESPPLPDAIAHWIRERQFEVLNVAGPRESFRPGVVYSEAFEFLKKVFESVRSSK
jgi:hypothetical protein